MSTSRLLPTNPDVLIIGAGAAGVAAAKGAAACGATVTVLEKNSFPGGKATASNVGTVCGLYYRSEQAQIKYAQSGFPMEFGNALAERCESSPIKYKNGLHFLPYHESHFSSLCTEIFEKSAATVNMEAIVNGAAGLKDRVLTVSAMVNGMQMKFHPATVIDASGFNCIASMLGLDAVTSDRYQAAAQVFGLSGINEKEASAVSLALIRIIRKGIAENLLEPFYEYISVVPGGISKDRILLKLPLPQETGNDPGLQSQLDHFAREAVGNVVNYLKDHSELFKNAKLSYLAPEAGIRTGPRNRGKFVISGQNVLSAAKFSDAVARGTWPVEYWKPGKPVRMEYFEMDNHYEIPSGCLQSNQMENLFFAGRNISADDTAIASARVIGTCLATGYAAGVMAAFYAQGKECSAAVHFIQQEIFATPVTT